MILTRAHQRPHVQAPVMRQSPSERVADATTHRQARQKSRKGDGIDRARTAPSAGMRWGKGDANQRSFSASGMVASSSRRTTFKGSRLLPPLARRSPSPQATVVSGHKPPSRHLLALSGPVALTGRMTPPVLDPCARRETESCTAAARPPQPLGFLVVEEVTLVKRSEPVQGLLGDCQQRSTQTGNGKGFLGRPQPPGLVERSAKPGRPQPRRASADGATDSARGAGSSAAGRRTCPSSSQTNCGPTTSKPRSTPSSSAPTLPGKKRMSGLARRSTSPAGLGGAGVEPGGVAAVGPFEQPVDADGLNAGELGGILRMLDRDHLRLDASRCRLTTKALDALREHSRRMMADNNERDFQ